MTTSKTLLAVAAWLTGVVTAGVPVTRGVGATQPLAADSHHWIGVIEVSSRRAVQQIPIVVTLDRVGSQRGDVWSGRFDISPGPSTPGLRAMPLSNVAVDATRMRFTTVSQDGEAHYDLALSPDGTRAEGRLSTSMGAMGVRLRRTTSQVARDAVIRRPQEPTGARGYVAREVFIASPSDGTMIYGTLTTPEGMSAANPAPGVVLIGDLGATDRDLSGAYHRPFLVLADVLSKAGFAVLRLDDRGVGQSGGDERMVTPEIAAADAAGALAALAGTEGVDGSRLGYIGLGEGAVTAAIAAAASVAPEGAQQGATPAFIVMLSPRGLPLLESQYMAAELAFAREGETGEYAATRLAARRRALEAAAASTSPYDAVAEPAGALADALREELTAYAAFGRGEVSDVQQSQGLRVEMADMTTASRVSRYRHDPAPVYERVGVPALVVGAGEDMVNPAAANVPAVVAALQKSPGAKVVSEAFPGINQMLQPCVTGLAPERLQIETTIDPRVLDVVTSWLRSAARMEK